MRRLNIKFYKGMNIKDTSKKKHNQHYETPKKIGEKGQMDVKYVPNECKSKDIPEDKKFYQYTYIDETTSQPSTKAQSVFVEPPSAIKTI